tara:strand:+ start:49071 stop:49709 length:639 start_codon:yes stop_codon:yes gene_type:complete
MRDDIGNILKEWREFLADGDGWKSIRYDPTDARAMAHHYHAGQVRKKSKKPYVEHPEAVAEIVRKFYPDDSYLYTLALLHDTIEESSKDTDGKDDTHDKELSVIHDIGLTYGKKMLDDVMRLSHFPGVPYNEYVINLSRFLAPLRVKLADMLHNASDLSPPPGWQSGIVCTKSPKGWIKYRCALVSLENRFNGRPEGISDDHWRELVDTFEL